MMITFYAGNASGPWPTWRKTTDHKGRPRAGVDVLRRDPVLVRQVVNSLDFKHRTTAAVIAWAPEPVIHNHTFLFLEIYTIIRPLYPT